MMVATYCKRTNKKSFECDRQKTSIIHVRVHQLSLSRRWGKPWTGHHSITGHRAIQRIALAWMHVFGPLEETGPTVLSTTTFLHNECVKQKYNFVSSASELHNVKSSVHAKPNTRRHHSGLISREPRLLFRRGPVFHQALICSETPLTFWTSWCFDISAV